jgi:hypothetical protein
MGASLKNPVYDGLNIVNEYNDAYEDAYYAWNPFYPLADRDLRFYLGEQWDEKERQKLFQENRNAFTFNLIRKNINLILGYHIQHQLSPIVLPRESSDQQCADDLTDLLLYAFDTGEGYRHISNSFGGALKTGFNLLTMWMDYRDDPVNGDIRFGREPYSGFITDPYFTQLDFSDCAYVMRRKYLSPEQAASLLPGMEKDIYEIHNFGWSRDDKFTWLPYQTQPNGQDYIAYDEFYKQKWKNVPTLVDEETGEYMEWEGSEEGLRFYKDKFPQLKVIQTPKRYVECHIILNNNYMKTEINQFGLNEYPFVPFVGIFEPESEFWGLKVQSLVRPMVDPQRESNRRRSQMVDILDSQINSGWIADEESVINPRSLFQTSQGKVIWRDRDAKPGAIEKIPPAQIPPSMFELQRQFDADIMSAIGINDASFGMTQNDQESGIMMMLRQGASLVNIQDLMENLRFAQKQAARKCIKMMQNWTPEKVKRILNREPSQQFYSKDFVKHDISIQESLLTGTQKQMYFRQLMDLKQAGAPVTGEMLAKAAPIQGKSEYVKQLEEMEKQQAQAAQEQQKIQMSLIDGQRQAQQAKAISDIALSKERFTRAVANMGLEDERAARAVDDRASASLDRARAMKELASLDDDRLVKYLSIVRMMEEMNAVKEEEIKEDDVTISARGQERAQNPLANPPLPDMTGMEQLQMPEQPLEV